MVLRWKDAELAKRTDDPTIEEIDLCYGSATVNVLQIFHDCVIAVK